MTLSHYFAFLILVLVGVWIGNGPPALAGTKAAPVARPAETLADAPGTAPAVPGCWNVVPSPDPDHNTLRDVAVVSANDVWAVGEFYETGILRPLIEHWNGTTWTVVPNPPGSGSTRLVDLAARASNDVWAVGDFQSFHWNGSVWSVIPPASDPTWLGAGLSSITTLAPNDVWAVGGYFTPGSDPEVPASRTLTEHWNGTTWSIVPSPNPRGGDDQNKLLAVTALAANDIWAVGTYGLSLGLGWQTLIEHWDGTAWTVVPSPNTNPLLNILKGISAVSPNDIWAVGYQEETFLILHWNGSTWTIVPGPPTSVRSWLYTVAAVSSNDVWAAGTANIIDNTLTLLHWDGLSWSAVNPVGPASYNQITGLAVVNANQVWAVGGPLTARYDYPCIPPTPAPPTATPPPSTTPHTGQFEDVPPGNTFYSYVECMGTRQIISGYPCGSPGEACVGPVNKPYFRPNNNVTRGQLAKIVSNAAGWNEQSTLQHFIDVPPNSTFWIYVERAYDHNVISGYPCGGLGEPCGPGGDGAYFRPNNPVTRGQTAKIVAIAAQFTETPTAQTFEDVPPSGTFYLWVERMASRGIIGGYPCGGPGEPCNPPANRPYFRPNNNVTRGQSAKIVTNSFFPNCQSPSPTPTATATTTPLPVTATPTLEPPSPTSTPLAFTRR